MCERGKKAATVAADEAKATADAKAKDAEGKKVTATTAAEKATAAAKAAAEEKAAAERKVATVAADQTAREVAIREAKIVAAKSEAAAAFGLAEDFPYPESPLYGCTGAPRRKASPCAHIGRSHCLRKNCWGPSTEPGRMMRR